MEKETLAIELILKEMDELGRSGEQTEVSTPVRSRETVIGNLHGNSRIMSLLLLFDLSIRAVHSARATAERMRSETPWGADEGDEARENYRLIKQLEAKRNLLQSLFYYELQTWLDEWEADVVGIRCGLDVVSYSKTRKTSDVLRQLLNEGRLED